MKIYIRGFAELQREIERNLSSHTNEIIEHILKLIVMPNHSARNHWESEIAAQLNKIKRLKSNKFPSAKQIYKWTYNKVQDLVTDSGWMGVAIRDIEDQYNVKVNMTADELCKAADSVCYEYFSWLAKELSSVGRVARRDIFNKLDELV